MPLIAPWDSLASDWIDRDPTLRSWVTHCAALAASADLPERVEAYELATQITRGLARLDPTRTAEACQLDVQTDRPTRDGVLHQLLSACALDQLGRMREALERLGTADIHVQALDDRALQLVVALARGRALVVHGDVLTASQVLLGGAGLAQRIGARRTEAKLLGNLGFLHAERDPPAYEAYTRRALALGRELGDDRITAQSLCNLGGALAQLQRLDEAQEAYAEGLPIAQQVGWAHGVAQFLGGMGGVASRRGRHIEGYAYYERSAREFDALGDTFQRTRQLVAMARCLHLAQRHPEAMHHCREALDACASDRFQSTAINAYELQSEIFERMGQTDQALAALRKTLELQRRTAEVQLNERIRLLELHVEVEQATRAAAWARERAAELEALLERQRVLQAEIEALARTDALTGLHNRRHLTELLTNELSRARRAWRPMSIALFDADSFKAINDTHGHDIGDDVLVALARRLDQTLRGHDAVARWGGEEFCMMLPETEAPDAQRVIERVLEHIRSEPIPTRAGPLRVTMSAGLTSLSPVDTGLEALLRRADRALYHAKRHGRDRLTVFTAADLPDEGGSVVGLPAEG
jgi:diguanylate cyclase (GGDEF)-like protein